MALEQRPGPAEIELNVPRDLGLLGYEGEEEREVGQTDLLREEGYTAVRHSLHTLPDQIVLSES